MILAPITMPLIGISLDTTLITVAVMFVAYTWLSNFFTK